MKFSEYIESLKNNEIHKGVSYTVRTGPAQTDVVDLDALYVIVDGGYLDWFVTMRGYGVSSEPEKYKFFDWVASVRKDVECFFGILKQRFRFFKNPITLRKKTQIDDAFVVACIIHNMI